MKTLNSVSARE